MAPVTYPAVSLPGPRGAATTSTFMNAITIQTTGLSPATPATAHPTSTTRPAAALDTTSPWSSAKRSKIEVMPPFAIGISVALGVLLSIGLLGLLVVWGYVLGQKQYQPQQQVPKKTQPLQVRQGKLHELEGEQILELPTRANYQELPEGRRPVAELLGREVRAELMGKELIELPAPIWAGVGKPETMRL